MILRPATHNDCPAIAKLWNPIIRDTLVTFNSQTKSSQDIAALLAARAQAGRCFLLAENDGAVLGFATYDQFRGGVGYAHTMEHTIILDETARGLGLGRALLQAVETHATAGGAHSMFAGVSADNHRAVAFHQAVGYSVVGHLPQVGFKFGKWLDLILLQKYLSASDTLTSS